MKVLLPAIAMAWLIAANPARSPAAPGPATEPAPRLAPGATFTVTFPQMPPTFYDTMEKKDVTAQMTVLLPRNYDPKRKHPLLVFLNGGDGGDGAQLGVARGLCQQQDFICVSLPLFKATDPHGPAGIIMRDGDASYMWPFFKTMLAQLHALVSNIDTAHQVLGGFSNGAHAAQGLIDQSDGEIAHQFCGEFFFVEGGGRLQHYDQLKGKPFLMLSSSAKSRPRAQQICDAANAAGARVTFVAVDVGKHDFPVSAYPAVRTWLRGPAIASDHQPSTQPASNP